MPNWFTTPLMPEAPVRRLQEQIDSPDLERSPWEAQLRGFGAGALEGLRDLTSPADLIGMAALPMGGGGGLLRAARGVQQAPGALEGLLNLRPSLSATRAMMPAEFVEPGAEALWNVGRAGAQAVDPAVAAYGRILARGGR